jgi:hypothetical protein
MAFRGWVLPRNRGVTTREGEMAKRHGRPSVQYRYEHYDPKMER